MSLRCLLPLRAPGQSTHFGSNRTSSQAASHLSRASCKGFSQGDSGQVSCGEGPCESGGPEISAALGDVAECGASRSLDSFGVWSSCLSLSVDGRSLLCGPRLAVFGAGPCPAAWMSGTWRSYHEFAAVFTAHESVSRSPLEGDVAQPVRIKVVSHGGH